MKKQFIIFSALFFICTTIRCQVPTWLFEGGTGSANAENAKAVCVDAAGNIYITGSFANTVDFDFGASVQNLVSNGSNDIFIASYTSAGGFRWAVRAGGVGNDNGSATAGICTDGTNVYVTGSYNGAATMFGAISLTPNGGSGQDGYVAKLNANTGAFIWAVSVGGTGNTDFGAAVCLDPSGNPYVVGQFNGTLNNGCAIVSGGGSELYVTKLNPTTGACVWASGGGSTTNDVVNGAGICYDPITTQLVVASNYNGGTATYGSFVLTNAGGNDLCVLELNSTTGVFTGAVSAGTAGNDDAIACAYDAYTGDVMVVGQYGGNITLPGSINLTNAGNTDAWLGRYSEGSNTFVWAKAGTGTGFDRANGVCVDGLGQVVIIGQFVSNPITFGAFSLTNTNSGGFDDIFVVGYYAANGTEVWTTKNTNSGVQANSNIGRSIAIQSSSINYWTCGQYSQGCTFGALGVLNSAGANDWYTAKFSVPSLCSTPTLNLSGQTNVSCFGGSNGSATMTATGASPFTYTWSPSGGNAATATGLSAGVYTCVTTNSCGLTASKTVTITQPASALTTATAVTNVLCFGGSTGSATVTASGGTPGYTYLWSTAATTSVISAQTSGVKTVTVTDANGCTSIKSVNITQPTSAVSTSTAVINVSCNGGSNGSATVTASGGTPGYAYLWSTAATTSAISAQTPGVKTVTVTDANGCSSVNSVNITQPASALSTATAVTNILCFGGATGSATVTASGGTAGYTYLWSTAATTSVISSQTAGVKTVTVTDANGCTSVKSVNITQPGSAVSSATAFTNVSCNGGNNGSATVTASGGTAGYTYLWSTAATTSVISSQTSGVKTVTVTDANGCITVNSVNITQPATGVSTSTIVVNISCNGGNNGSATVTASGGTPGYTYLWSTAATTSVISGQTSGVKTVTVTDANGCTTVNSANITQPATGVSTSTSVTNISCNGGSNGSATVTASGGTPGYTYLWSTAATTSVISGQTSGVKTVTVTDANGCINVNSANITQPATGVSTSTIVANISCNGGSNGSATVTASGGTPGYTYLWSTSATTSVISGQTSGVKTVTVTDANGCSTVNSVNITQPSAITSTQTQTNVLCNGGNTGFASVNASGGTGILSYSWAPSGPPSSSNPNLTAGSYTCYITDANSCVLIKTFTITQPTSISASLVSTTAPGCALSNGAITISATGGTGALSYSWSPSGGTSTTASGLSAGTYSCVITDANNCTYTISQSLSNPNSPTVVAFIVNAGCAGQTNGSITLTVSGGTPAYNYTWLPSVATTSIATSLGAGVYNVTVTDASSCTTMQSYTITAFVLPTVSAVSTTSMLCIGQTATLSASGASTYTWNPGGSGSSIVVSPTSNTTYTLVGTDANGCQNNTTITQTVISCGGVGMVSQTSSKTELIIYPNPSNGVFNVQGNFSETIYVYNVLGVLVQAEQCTATEKCKIDLSQKLNGIYFVKVGNTIKKIIKE